MQSYHPAAAHLPRRVQHVNLHGRCAFRP